MQCFKWVYSILSKAPKSETMTEELSTCALPIASSDSPTFTKLENNSSGWPTGLGDDLTDAVAVKEV